MWMEKVKVNIKVNDYIVKGEGKIDNNILKIANKEEQISFDLKKLVLNRETKEIKMMLDFKNKSLKYMLKKTNSEINTKITVLSLTNKDKEYNIMYQMEQNILNLKIKYEKL